MKHPFCIAIATAFLAGCSTAPETPPKWYQEVAARSQAEEESKQAERQADNERFRKYQAQDRAHRKAILDAYIAGRPDLTKEQDTRLRLGLVFIGLPADIVQAVKGLPNNRNVTTTAAGQSEQWIYNDSFTRQVSSYYFEGGILTSMQVSE